MCWNLGLLESLVAKGWRDAVGHAHPNTFVEMARQIHMKLGERGATNRHTYPLSNHHWKWQEDFGSLPFSGQAPGVRKRPGSWASQETWKARNRFGL